MDNGASWSAIFPNGPTEAVPTRYPAAAEPSWGTVPVTMTSSVDVVLPEVVAPSGPEAREPGCSAHKGAVNPWVMKHAATVVRTNR